MAGSYALSFALIKKGEDFIILYIVHAGIASITSIPCLIFFRSKPPTAPVYFKMYTINWNSLAQLMQRQKEDLLVLTLKLYFQVLLLLFYSFHLELDLEYLLLYLEVFITIKCNLSYSSWSSSCTSRIQSNRSGFPSQWRFVILIRVVWNNFNRWRISRCDGIRFGSSYVEFYRKGAIVDKFKRYREILIISFSGSILSVGYMYIELFTDWIPHNKVCI